jgi:hypothetical protein
LPELAKAPEFWVVCWPALAPAVPMYDAKALRCSSFAIVVEKARSEVLEEGPWEARGR